MCSCSSECVEPKTSLRVRAAVSVTTIVRNTAAPTTEANRSFRSLGQVRVIAWEIC